MQRRRVLLAVSLVATTTWIAASCTGSEPVSSPTTAYSEPTTTTRPDDGILVIGAVLPTIGSAADLGVAMSDALALAVTEINSSGGVNGNDVRLEIREEGDNPATAALAVQSLLQVGVDAIIGPTSSLNMLSTLGAVVEAGVLTCGPTSSARALDQFPDRSLFFRTIPSDSLQAIALASLVEDTGVSRAAVVYLDDGYGRPFALDAQAAITLTGTDVSALVAFTASEESVQAAVDAIVDDRAQVVTVIADSATGPTIINAIDEATDGAVQFVVNDPIRRPAADSEPISSSLADRVMGVSPLARSTQQSFLEALLAIDPDGDALFAHNAYDCLNLIALAADSAGSSTPAAIASDIPAISTSGTICLSYTECNAALAASRNIDYDGPSGSLDIGVDGNVVGGVFERFTFDDSGRDVGDGLLRVDIG